MVVVTLTEIIGISFLLSTIDVKAALSKSNASVIFDNYQLIQILQFILTIENEKRTAKHVFLFTI